MPAQKPVKTMTSQKRIAPGSRKVAGTLSRAAGSTAPEAADFDPVSTARLRVKAQPRGARASKRLTCGGMIAKAAAGRRRRSNRDFAYSHAMSRTRSDCLYPREPAGRCRARRSGDQTAQSVSDQRSLAPGAGGRGRVRSALLGALLGRRPGACALCARQPSRRRRSACARSWRGIGFGRDCRRKGRRSRSGRGGGGPLRRCCAQAQHEAQRGVDFRCARGSHGRRPAARRPT